MPSYHLPCQSTQVSKTHTSTAIEKPFCSCYTCLCHFLYDYKSEEVALMFIIAALRVSCSKPWKTVTKHCTTWLLTRLKWQKSRHVQRPTHIASSRSVSLYNHSNTYRLSTAVDYTYSLKMLARRYCTMCAWRLHYDCIPVVPPLALHCAIRPLAYGQCNKTRGLSSLSYCLKCVKFQKPRTSKCKEWRVQS